MGKKILIVDDAIFMRKMLGDILSREGYEVVGEGEDGEDAYDKYRILKPDLVTMDITMPHASGIEGVRLIMGAFPDANIIMCSAMGQDTMIQESEKYGAKGFIIKPFKPEQVIETVEKIIGRP